MSLIIDALKRAQQLRLNGSEGSPILKVPYPKKKRGGRFKKRWIPVGAGLISLCIVLFVFLRPASSPLATQTNRLLFPWRGNLKKNEGRMPPSSVSAAEKISSEPPKEVLSLTENREPPPMGQALNPAGAAEPYWFGADRHSGVPQRWGAPQWPPFSSPKRKEIIRNQDIVH